MSRFTKISAVLLAISSSSLFVNADAVAREGGWRSTGQGIKCINQAVLQPNGTFRVQQVCAKRG